MSDEQVAACLRCMREAEEAEGKVIEVVERVLEVADKLKANWAKVAILPPKTADHAIMPRGGIAIRENEWPSLEEIKTVYADWRVANDRWREAASPLTGAERDSLPAPPPH